MTNPIELVKIILEEINVKKFVRNVEGFDHKVEVHCDGIDAWIEVNNKNVGKSELAIKILEEMFSRGIT